MTHKPHHRFRALTTAFALIVGARLAWATEKVQGASGSGEVNEFSGSFSHSVPIEAPGFRSLTPKLGLAYSSSTPNAFAGVGTQEAGWVLGFGILGIERDTAFATGLAVHLVQLFNVCAMGLAGHVAMGLMPRVARTDAGTNGGEPNRPAQRPAGPRDVG